MVSMAQIESGLTRFIDNELAPKIPADGQWHRLVVDLTRLEDFVGNVSGSEKLSTVTKTQFFFTGSADGVILLDQFELLF